MEYLVLDIGGSAIKYAVMDEETNFILKDKVPTPRDSKESFIKAVLDLYDKVKDRVNGIAISMPGVIDSRTGYAYSGGALEYLDKTNIVDLFSKYCDKKITIENDGKCAVKAEYWIGSLKGCENAATIVLGTGVGGGIISNGKILKGNHFSAGEFSFIKTNIDQPESADNVWCMKNGNNILCRKLAAKKNIDIKEMDGIKFFELANNKDSEALEVLNEFCKNLCVEIFNVQTILDCEKISIGGGISAQPILFEYIKKNMDEMYDEFDFTCPIVMAEIVPSTYRNDSNLIGALYTYLYE
ncbi:MAG: ROK family protein [Clostridium sp.]|nr:ROK family protein [Clostridium sp.]